MIFPCPINNPKICATVISLLSPIPYTISKNLLESLAIQAHKTQDLAEKIFPEIAPIDYTTQVHYALRRIVGNTVESIWTTSYIPHYIKQKKVLSESQGIITQTYSSVINASEEKIFKLIKSIGGENGYYFANILWDIRAFIDKLIGGIRKRNGRRDPFNVHIGETIDFWRVENIKENSLLLLRSEMKLPGKGWLKFDIKNSNNTNILNITAYFEPRGFLGYIYWYLCYPIHHFVFKGLIKKISELATKNS
ncbi:MAG: DUF2867 domain-containing protein [Elusimicrobiota bacterium]